MTSDSPFPTADARLFSWPTRVYWEDTDAGGVVYHAQYVAFLERARTEWLRHRGHGQERLRNEHDLVFAVRAMQLDFLRPARLDDLLSRIRGRIVHSALDHVSPFAVPSMLEIGRERVAGGSAQDMILAEAEEDLIAEALA